WWSDGTLKGKVFSPLLRPLRYFHLSVLSAVLTHDTHPDALFQQVSRRLSTLAIYRLGIFEPEHLGQAPVCRLLVGIKQQTRSRHLDIPQGLIIVIQRARHERCRDTAAYSTKPAHYQCDVIRSPIHILPTLRYPRGGDANPN